MPDMEEVIHTQFCAIEAMLRVAFLAEEAARRTPNALLEDSYLETADHAIESARQLFILTHK